MGQICRPSSQSDPFPQNVKTLNQAEEKRAQEKRNSATGLQRHKLSEQVAVSAQQSAADRAHALGTRKNRETPQRDAEQNQGAGGTRKKWERAHSSAISTNLQTPGGGYELLRFLGEPPFVEDEPFIAWATLPIQITTVPAQKTNVPTTVDDNHSCFGMRNDHSVASGTCFLCEMAAGNKHVSCKSSSNPRLPPKK